MRSCIITHKIVINFLQIKQDKQKHSINEIRQEKLKHITTRHVVEYYLVYRRIQWEVRLSIIEPRDV